MRKAIGLAMLFALTLSCAHMRQDKTVCPEYRGMYCATAPECSFDQSRGCSVCQCSPAGADQNGGLPSGLPPDRR
jgi:hypothetical protein